MTNPGNFVAHRQLLLGFVRDFGVLAAAYRLSGDERFARTAVRQAHLWFVDPETRMNPTLLYSQAIQGLNTGRSIGVIDTLHLAEVALGVEALRGSRALTASEETALTGWFRDYLQCGSAPIPMASRRAGQRTTTAPVPGCKSPALPTSPATRPRSPRAGAS